MTDAHDARLFNPEAEQYLIGAMMTDNLIVDRIADALSADDFGAPLYARIYSLICREVALGRPANPVTLKAYLSDDPDFQKAGGTGYLAELTAKSYSFGTSHVVSDLQQLAARRRLVEGLNSALDKCADPETSLAELVDEADAAMMSAMDGRDPLHQPTAADCIDEVLAGLDEPFGGVRSGVIGSLDDLTGPLKPKQLVIMAGRPGMGKTAVAVSYGLGAARQGNGVLFVSLEMGSQELGARMASDLCHRAHGGVPFAHIRDANLNDFERQQIAQARDEARHLPFRVVDTGKITISRLAMVARRHKRMMAARGQSLDLLIVDYLQLVHPDGKARSAYEAVSEVSRGLKQLAKDLGITVLALAQLSREVEKRDDKRPMLSDLRDSGQIEQDADSVLFLYREEYYLGREEPKEDSGPKRESWIKLMQEASGKIEFILAKRRNGRTGENWGHFFGEYQAVRGRDFYRLETVQ